MLGLLLFQIAEKSILLDHVVLFEYLMIPISITVRSKDGRSSKHLQILQVGANKNNADIGLVCGALSFRSDQIDNPAI